jgi:DNA-binding NtrC family response regulator
MPEKNNLIFIVEDDVPFGKLIQYYLKRNGFKNVVLFAQANKCLDSFRYHPEIVITDYRLKSYNGLKLIQKAKKIYADFYCILLSGYQEEDIFEAKISKQNVDIFIRKELDCVHKLIRTVNNYFYPEHVEELC